MLDELAVLKIVTKRLEAAGVPYMVSGSVAANFYTTPRMTRDIDIIIEVGESDAEKLFSIFSDDFYVDMEAINNALHSKQMFNIIHNEAIVKVDFIIRKDTEYRKVEFQRRRRVIFEDLGIYVTAPEDLIISNLYWAKNSLSEMQIRDVRNLLKTVHGLDLDYIEKWVRELGIEEIYREANR